MTATQESVELTLMTECSIWISEV